MRTEVESQFAPFLRTVTRASRALLLVDYDGTLAPFHVKREQAFPYEGVALLLEKFMRNGRTRVIVVSGRDAREIPPLLNIQPRPEVWGVHGLQRLKTDGTIEMARLDERTINGLSDADRWLNCVQLKDVAEIKDGSIAIHWRGMSDTEVEDLRGRVMSGWRLIAEHGGLDLLQFDGGVEIRASEADKGQAVRALLNEVGRETPVAYLGDDLTDESAFLVMKGRGISVLVRPELRPTAAQFWLKPPEQVLEFLGLWLKACAEQDVLGSSAAAHG